jgi:hypothetical protein
MKQFNLHYQGLVYALTLYGHNKKDAIHRYKIQHHLNRMPNGYCIWEA